jgi:hypothetical protein
MTKKEARAMLAFSKRLHFTCDALQSRLAGSELMTAEAYYLAHVRGIANGDSYGSVPMRRAEEVLGL